MRAAANRRKLTPLFIQKVKPRAAPFMVWDTYQHGLVLRVEKSGHRSYKAVYRFGGRPRWFHIGSASAIKLGEARRLAGRIMFQVAEGKDPQAIKRSARNAGTFDEVADQYLERFAKKQNKSWQQADKLVRKHLRPRWGKLPAGNVTRSDVRAMMDRITPTAPIVANQTLAAASAIFSWCIKNEVGNVSVNPCHGVERNQTKDRERVLSDGELKLFWQEFDKAGIEGAALKMMLLTVQRPGEVSRMHKSHLVDGWWSMPGEPVKDIGWLGIKNHKSHRVWLSKQAVEIIGSTRGNDLIFGGPMGGLPELDVTMRSICTKLRKNKIKVERATPHDLRRTAGSAITRLGFGEAAMDRIMNHKKRSVTSVYNRYKYEAEDKVIMEALANHMLALAAGTAADSNVLPFVAGKT